MTSLCTLLLEAREPDLEVAWRRGHGTRHDAPGGVVCWDAFQRDVTRLRERLAASSTQAAESPGWLLLTEDAYAFAVGLFALWHAGCHAILPPNRQEQSVASLAVRARGVLCDRPGWIPGIPSLHPLEGDGSVDRISLAPLPAEALAVELYTSGTTGGASAIAKQIRHLDDEVSELAKSFDTRIAGSTVFSTASHQHLYGLLFGVLWPLRAGRRFHAHHFLHVGEMLPRMLETDRFALASVPTTLKRLARHAGTPQLRGRCVATFSSGGPLAEDTAHELTALIGHPPIEVFGSTETGGIAWREQTPGKAEPLWTPFPAVRVGREEETGLLRVRSPFVSVRQDELGYATGDRISLRAEGRFALEGRSDQVVKVGEKRLDLAQMADALRRHEAVEDVALATIERDGEPRVAAVVVPSARGSELIEHEGREGFRRVLRATLRQIFDPVLHPRYWRIVSELPANSQGKMPLDAIRALFAPGKTRGAASDRPEVLDEFSGRDFVERSCRVPMDLACFPGHFPDVPVVPGVLQLDWAMELAAQILGHTPRVVEVESLKLSSPLRPGRQFRLHSRVTESAKVEFRLWSGSETHATGRVSIEEA